MDLPKRFEEASTTSQTVSVGSLDLGIYDVNYHIIVRGGGPLLTPLLSWLKSCSITHIGHVLSEYIVTDRSSKPSLAVRLQDAGYDSMYINTTETRFSFVGTLWRSYRASAVVMTEVPE